MTNEHLHSTGNSTQFSAVTKMGRKSEKDSVQLTHFAVPQKLTAL